MRMPSSPLFVRACAAWFACAVVLLPSVSLAQTPDDTDMDEQWYLGTIDASQAWETVTGSHDVIVAVLDTGVDLDHPDLRDNIWTNEEEIANNNVDDDDNGFVDDVYGWDFVQDDNAPSPSVSGSDAAISHGTVIAGIIAASGNNGQGTVGVAWDASIMAVRMLNASGAGDSTTAARAVDYAVANGADIINLSFAGENVDSTLRRSIRNAYRAGVVVVSALGNETADTDDVAVYPACLKEDDEDWVIGVASSTADDHASDFSNYGATCTDLAAPGEDFYGPLYYNRAQGFTEAYGGGWSGTSMSAPVVSGAVVLLLAAYPDLSVDDIRNALKLSVDPLSLSRSMRGKYGAGRLNVARALEVAAQYSALTAPAADDEGSETDETDDAVTTEETDETATPTRGAAYIVTAATSGGQPTVDVRTASGAPFVQFAAYGASFTGGMSVATGDVDGDGDMDIVTGAGAGGGPHVRVFTAQGALLSEFFPFATTSRGGVQVAVGDVDGDGTDEIVSVVGSGVSRDVVVSTMRGVVVRTFTASTFAATDALRVAVGDVDGDNKGEILMATGKGSAPKVAVYDDNGTYLLEFAPYAATFTGGVYVAAGDVDGDGVDEMVTGTGDGGGPHVRIFTRIGADRGSFFAYDATSRRGVRVAVADVDRDGVAEILAAPGPGGGVLRVLTASGVETVTWAAPVTGGEGTAVASW